MASFALAGVAISLGVDYVVLRVLLRPLDHLQRAVDAVRAGGSGVRVAREGLSDERFEHLADTFDRMLATLEEHAERLRLLPGQILRAQEEERRRIARELHDEAAQSITSLLVRLRLLEQSQTPETARQRVRELRKLTEATRAMLPIQLEVLHASSFDQVRERLVTWHPDALMLDWNPAQANMTVRLKGLITEHPELRVLVLLPDSAREYREARIRSGLR